MKRKAASPKTLLASLLAIGIVIYKIINFEDIFDLLWIALFGYLLVKGLRVAFSQEAYDEDVRRAYQGRALYEGGLSEEELLPLVNRYGLLI